MIVCAYGLFSLGHHHRDGANVTWLEVVDSAVKIGLGAIIAGLSALVLAKAQHRHTLDKAKIDREFQLLTEIAEKVERFTHTALKFWALASDWQRALRTNPHVVRSSQLKKAQAELFDRFNDVTAAEATLLLMGQEEAQSELRTYGEFVVSFRKSVLNSTEPLSDEVINDYRSYFLRSREAFFKQLHSIYRDLGPKA